MRIQIAVIAAVALVLGVLSSNAAYAGKDGKGKAHKPDFVEKAHGKSEDSEIFGFNDKEVDIIAGVLKELYGEDENVRVVRPSKEFCPPGLAKKNNGCMPPGQAKKYNVGERLPEDTIISEIPKVLRDVLGLPPKGKKYVQVDDDVLLIQEGTKLVLDAIGLGR